MKKATHLSEVDLCRDAIEAARAEGWTDFQECCGFDFVLAAGDGTTVGVEAKLNGSLKLLGQAVSRRRAERVPDYIAVLVSGHPDRQLGSLCHDLRLVYWPLAMGFRPPCTLRWRLDMAGGSYRCEGKRLILPSMVEGSPAGSPSPVQLTAWKRKALQILATIEATGRATRDDFSRAKLSVPTWVDSGWITRNVDGDFVAGPAFRQIPDQHPGLYARLVDAIRRHGVRGIQILEHELSEATGQKGTSR